MKNIYLHYFNKLIINILKIIYSYLSSLPRIIFSIVSPFSFSLYSPPDCLTIRKFVWKCLYDIYKSKKLKTKHRRFVFSFLSCRALSAYIISIARFSIFSSPHSYESHSSGYDKSQRNQQINHLPFRTFRFQAGFIQHIESQIPPTQLHPPIIVA